MFLLFIYWGLGLGLAENLLVDESNEMTDYKENDDIYLIYNVLCFHVYSMGMGLRIYLLVP